MAKKYLNTAALEEMFNQMANIARKDFKQFTDAPRKVIYNHDDLEGAIDQIGTLIKASKRVGGVSPAVSILEQSQSKLQPSLFDGSTTDFPS